MQESNVLDAIINFMNIFIARLNYSTSPKDLKNLFEQFGPVVSSRIIKDKETGKSKGYGFVEMENAQDGLQAIERLNEQEFMGRNIIVKPANEKSND